MISAANGVWIDKSLSVEASFKDHLETSYKAAFNQVDFRTKADEVTEEVNSWVEKQTNGLITDLLSSVHPLTDLIFANALFFNGRWDKEFDPSLTEDSEFHLLDGITKARVPFMTGASYKYSLDAYQGFKVLDLPYRQGRDYMEDCRIFSMQIYLPDEKDGLPAMLERLASCRGFLNGKETFLANRQVSENSRFQGLNLLLASNPRKLSRVWVWSCHWRGSSTSLASRSMKWDRKLQLLLL